MRQVAVCLIAMYAMAVSLFCQDIRTVRMDANNLFPETRWLNSANTQVNFTSPRNFGKFPATGGYSFSNWYGPNGTLQGVLRIAF